MVFEHTPPPARPPTAPPQEVDGKYIGNRPIHLKRAEVAEKDLGAVNKRRREEEKKLRKR